MDFKKAYDLVDREALWQLLRMCNVDGKLLKGIKKFLSWKLNKCYIKLSELFDRIGGMRRGV